jgi:hypothetical protein
MASAHGAGLMVLPIVLHSADANAMPANHQMPMTTSAGTGIAATLVHTVGYLSVTGLIALLVYRKFGLALLRQGWFNLDLLWAAALVVTGCLALVA